MALSAVMFVGCYTQSELDEHKETYEALASQAQAQVSAANQVIAELEAALVASGEVATKLQSDLETTLGQLSEALILLGTIEATAGDLFGNILALAGDGIDSSDVEGIRAAFDSSLAILGVNEEAAGGVNQYFGALHAYVGGLEITLAELSAELAAAKAELAASDQVNDNLVDRIAALEAEVAELADGVIVETVEVIRTITQVVEGTFTQGDIDSAVANAVAPFVDANGNPLPTGADVSNADSTGWLPAFADQTADFDQTNVFSLTYEGRDYTATDNRTVSVSESTEGATSFNGTPVVTYDGFDTQAQAVAAIENDDTLAPGLHTISVLTVTSVTNVASKTTYTFTVDSTEVFSHFTGGEETAGTSNSATTPQQYTKGAAPVDPADTYTYSDWASDGTATSSDEFLNEVRTATLVQNGDLDDPAPATDVLTRTGVTANPGYVPPVAVTTGVITIIVQAPGTILGNGNNATVSVADGATVSVGDVITVTWSDTNIQEHTITEEDLSDGTVTITVTRDFATSTKS